MSSSKTLTVRVLTVVVALTCIPAAAQISSLNFQQMQLNGSAIQATNGGGQQVLSLTQDGQELEAGSAWYMTQQSVASGFTTVFTFQITHNSQFGPGPADGFAFVLQNANNFGEGNQLAALGGPGGDIGYGFQIDEGVKPIDNSIAIEFDTFQNSWDPNGNHVAVQSCGTGNNTAEHNQICDSGASSTLGIAATPGVNLADGNVHSVMLQYDPGTLTIYIDNSGMPVLTVPVQIGTLLALNEGTNNNLTGYVGFTGATEDTPTEETDILSWTFTPGGVTQPTTITQTLTPGPGPFFTNYVFGSYNHKYEYSNANPGDVVTVTAMPTSPSIVNPVLTSFAPNASCIVYDGTGGDCVVFQVSCTETTGSDCTNLPYTLFEGYNTQQTINQPCLLKTEVYSPPSPSTWINIETAFSQTRFDPVSTGNSKGFSYFVAAQNCGSPASGLNGTNCNGVYSGAYWGNLTVSNGQSCTFSNGGVIGNLTENGGTVVLENNSFVLLNLHERGGNLYVSNSSVGNLQVDTAGSFSIGPTVNLWANLLAQNLAAGTGPDQVCGTTIWGSLFFQNSAAPIQIGSTTSCAGNVVGGNVQVQNNSGATVIDSNTVYSNVVDQNNTGATQVFSNTISHNLTCSGNTSITGGGNKAQRKQGQCAGF